jgi:hypothetical protein
MRIATVLVKLVFILLKVSKMEQRAVTMFCIKFKKPAIKMFEMLKSTYDETYLSRTSELNGIKGSKKD